MSKESKIAATKIFVIVAFTFEISCLILTIVSYALPSWILLYPSPPKTTMTVWNDYNRTRGIFEECIVNYKPNSINTATPSSPYLINYRGCILIEFTQYKLQIYNVEETQIIRLRLSQICLHGLAIFLNFCNLVMGFGLLFKWFFDYDETSFHLNGRYFMISLDILIFLLLLASSIIGLMLGLNEARNNSLSLPSLSSSNIAVEFKEMFMLSWIACGMILLALLFQIISVILGCGLIKERYKPHELNLDNFAYSKDSDKPTDYIIMAPIDANYVSSAQDIQPNSISSASGLPRQNVSNFNA